MNINLRPATEADFPEIIGMIKELALFEKAPEKVTNSVEQMQREKDLFRCIMAENETGQIVGMALYFFAYYTWVGKSLYLDDLYIKPQYRGNGIGTMLLNEIMRISKEEKCTRVRWQVLDWNTPAIELYKKMGMTLDDEWINCDWINESGQ
ncbi:MAG: GNAT family N-acetyltransferase [Bacteroidetes bacterium HGW-Bacteroidetes-6]|jgi:ribosomal protein S18 acetylase RimI-like enzyme|nr:MAG: GNAT family N-acetyltransferase [Bacteroidetes bacterium HGW-Bacteroidetes-6]